MSKQLDERLRRAARTCRELGKYTTENMFLEASDTICKLRDDLQRANAENAKLRELVSHLYKCMCNVDAFGSHECDLCEYDNAEGKCDFERLMRELGVDEGEE